VEAHLADKTYLVGDAITLADITLFSALIYPFKFVCCPEFRGAIPNVMRWFNTVANQPSFIDVAGEGPNKLIGSFGRRVGHGLTRSVWLVDLVATGKVKLAEEELLPSGVVPELGGPSKKGGDKKEKAKADKPKADKPKPEKKVRVCVLESDRRCMVERCSS
jgi:elongation factor 1-gamma